MSNNRIFYPHVAFGIAPQDTLSFTEVHGVQEVGLDTNLNIEFFNEIGQFTEYASIEDIPEVEITVDRFLDGYALLYHLATVDATANTLNSRANVKCNAAVSIFDDDQDAASGTPLREMQASGLYADAGTYTLPVEGVATESITLRGNHMSWLSTGFAFTGTIFDDSDEPLAVTSGLGGLQRRENMVFVGADLDSVTILPNGFNGIPGISASGTNDKTGDTYGAHIQDVTISFDVGREEIPEQGRKLPYYRAPEGIIDVTCEINVVSINGPNFSVLEEGVVSGLNAHNKTIRIQMEDGTRFDLGTRNKPTSVQFGGLSATGGYATDTYSYSNRNFLRITHSQNPGVND